VAHWLRLGFNSSIQYFLPWEASHGAWTSFMEGNDFGSATLITVLRIRDAYPGDPDSRVKKIPDAGSESVSRNISIFIF
jgi:hypothetical protein